MKKAAGSHRPTRMRSKNRSGFSSEQTPDTAFRSTSVSLFRIFIQCFFCIGTVVVGFRFTREANFLRAGFHHPEDSFSRTVARTGSSVTIGNRNDLDLQIHQEIGNVSKAFRLENSETIIRSRVRVDVGRHAILVRPWPHPDPFEVMQAHHLIARVQMEQQQLYGSKESKPIIAITTTFARSFQAVHLTGLLHTLSLVPVHVTWIVMEAGGVTNETAYFLSKARVHRLLHLGFGNAMPPGLKERGQLEAHMRVEALRYVREEKMEGIVVFADESNVYSLEFFTEAQKVDWMGAVSIGLLGFAGFEEPAQLRIADVHQEEVGAGGRNNLLAAHQEAARPRFEPQVQGPSCDSDGNFVGWHTFDPLLLEDGVHTGIMLAQTRMLEWASFVLNARTVWNTEGNQPEWIKSWDEWASPKDGSAPEIKAILRDDKQIKALGDCGCKVLLWWLHAEARADSKHPANWVLDEDLEIIVPAKSTPWPDRPVRFPPPPPPPAATTVGTVPKQGAGSRVPRGKGRHSKRRQNRPNIS